jgi:hypothetical protein
MHTHQQADRYPYPPSYAEATADTPPSYEATCHRAQQATNNLPRRQTNRPRSRREWYTTIPPRTPVPTPPTTNAIPPTTQPRPKRWWQRIQQIFTQGQRPSTTGPTTATTCYHNSHSNGHNPPGINMTDLRGHRRRELYADVLLPGTYV